MNAGHTLLSGKDGAPTYVMLYNGAMAPGAVSHADTGGHTHGGNTPSTSCRGRDPGVRGQELRRVGRRWRAGAGHVQHQWRNETQAPMLG